MRAPGYARPPENPGSSETHDGQPVNGTTLSYQERGRGARNVALLHGFPLDSRMWEQQLAALGDAPGGYRVVAPFMRGYAPSGIPSDDTSSRMLGEDVIALMAAFKSETARIVGQIDPAAGNPCR